MINIISLGKKKKKEYCSGFAIPSSRGSSQPRDQTHVSCFLYWQVGSLSLGSPGGSEVKVSACNVGDLGSIPGSGISPGEGNGNPLQYSCLENPMGGGASWVIQSTGLQRVRHD